MKKFFCSFVMWGRRPVDFLWITNNESESLKLNGFGKPLETGVPKPVQHPDDQHS